MKFSDINLNLNVFVPMVPVLTGHTQTILGHIVPSKTQNLKFTEHILKLADGDELFLEWLDNKSDYTLSIYHGLAGDSSADYVRRSADLGNSWAGTLCWLTIAAQATRPRRKGPIIPAVAKMRVLSFSGREKNFLNPNRWPLGFR